MDILRENPWIGYATIDGTTVVSGGAVVGAPQNSNVEIAYSRSGRRKEVDMPISRPMSSSRGPEASFRVYTAN
jgi:hypothetical protein